MKEVSEKTKAALEAIVQGKVSSSQPTYVPKHNSNATFIRWVELSLHARMLCPVYVISSLSRCLLPRFCCIYATFFSLPPMVVMIASARAQSETVVDGYAGL